MIKPLMAGVGVLLLAASAAAAHMPKYGVKSKADSSTNFTALTTYQWEPGWDAWNPSHPLILAAVERELAAIGFRQVDSGPSDVLVTYQSLRRNDIDLNSKMRTADGMRPSYPVVSIVVRILDSGTHKELFHSRIDTPIAPNEPMLSAQILNSVARLFARYPTRR